MIFDDFQKILENPWFFAHPGWLRAGRFGGAGGAGGAREAAGLVRGAPWASRRTRNMSGNDASSSDVQASFRCPRVPISIFPKISKIDLFFV